MELESLLLERGEASLSPRRWKHSLRCADYACLLADHYNVGQANLRCAALAHDLARELDSRQIIEMAHRDHGRLTPFSLDHPVLLHGFASAWILRDEYDVSDASLLNAVRYHTTGHPKLDDCGLILFAADYMEPGRKHLNDSHRNVLLEKSLQGMIISILEAMFRHLASRNNLPAPESRELYQKLKEGYNKPS